MLVPLAALWDAAYWGQPDAAHALWLVVAFGLVATYRWRWGWAAAALEAMTKPQAWFLLPLFACRELVVGGPRARHHRRVSGLGGGPDRRYALSECHTARGGTI